MTQYFDLLKNHMGAFLENKISADEIVSYIDDFVSEDHVCNLQENLCSKILYLQDVAALYVADPHIRKENDIYLNEDQLYDLIEKFFKIDLSEQEK